MLIGAFAGGYHLGRQKDSPDLVGYARQAVVAVAAVVGDMVDSFSSNGGGQADARDDYRAGADTSRDGRPYADTRAYVNNSYARKPDQPQTPGTEVAQATGKPDLGWAARFWKSLHDQPEGQ